MIYWFGVVTAYVIALIKVALSVGFAVSTRASNLAKVEYYYDPWNGSYLNRTPASKARWAGSLIWLLIVTPLFSWLTVGSAAFGYFKAKAQSPSSTPEKLKALQYKLASFDLTKEQVEDLLVEINQAAGISYTKADLRAAQNQEDPNKLVISDDDYEEWIKIDRHKKTLISCRGFYDEATRVYEEIEYRFDRDRLLSRTINAYEGNRRDREEQRLYFIQDSVPRNEELRERTRWSEIDNLQVKFFVMARHPEIFSEDKLRLLANEELDRIHNGCQKIIDQCRPVTSRVRIEGGDGYEVLYPHNAQAADKEKIDAIFSDDNFLKIGITKYEFCNAFKIREQVLKAIGESAQRKAC